MKLRKINFLFFVIFILFVSFGILTSGYTISNYDYSGSMVTSNAYYSTGLDYEDCAGGSDFLIQIEPFSCKPIVVTSDLLEEEPVTIYCKVIATQVNPFIDVDTITRIRITGDYSRDVQSVGYFPSEAALGYWYDGSLDNLALNDLGYVAITLRQNPNESSMPDFVEGELTARLTYDIENSFGIGNAQFYLPVLNDNEFEDNTEKYSFWDGRGYARALSVDGESATIALYTSSFQRIGSVQLEKGEVSNELYISNMNPCLATMKVRLNDLEEPDTRVKLKVNSDYIEVSDGESFLDGACKIRSVTKNGINQEVSIYCKNDEGKAETFNLKLYPKVSLQVDDEVEEYAVGDRLFTDDLNQKTVYLGYIGSKGDSIEKEDLFVVLVANPYSGQEKLTSSQISSIAIQMNLLFDEVDTGAGVVDFAGNVGKKILGVTVTAGKWVVAGQDFIVLETSGSQSKVEFKEKEISIKGFSGAEDSGLVSITEEIYSASNNIIKDDSGVSVGLSLEYSDIETTGASPKISLKNSNDGIVANFYGEDCETHEDCSEYILSGTGLKFEEGDYEGFFDDVVSGIINSNTGEIVLKKLVSSDSGAESLSSEYYADAMGDYETLANSYSSQTTDTASETYGERGLYEAIMLSYKLGQMKTMLELCDEFKGSYPDSEKLNSINSVCDNEYKISNSELSVYEVQVNGDLKEISFEGVYEPSYEEYGAEVVVRGANGRTESFELKKGKKVYLNDFREDVDTSVIYSYSDGNKKVYYKFDEKWSWSFDKDEWSEKILDEEDVSESHINTMKKLVDYGEEKGVALLEGKGATAEGGETTNEYLELISVDEDSAQIKVNALKETATSKAFEPSTKNLEIDESDNFGSAHIFTVIDTNIERNAKITIIPSFNYQQSESKFNFKIGIEKRTILLSDEMIHNRIETLNDSMKTLNEVVDGLDKFNRALGGVCLATGGYLTLKNLIKNSDGSAIAREEVMNSEGGWTERCNQYLATGTYSSASSKPYTSLEDCFFENANAIDAQVDEMQGIMEAQNEQIKSLQEATSSNGVINSTKFTQEYSRKVSNSLDNVGSSVSNSEGEGDSINVEDIQGLLDSDEAISSGVYDSQDLRDIQRYAELYSNALETDKKAEKDETKFYQDNLYSALSDLVINAQSFNAAQDLKSASGLENSYAIMNLDRTSKEIEIAITGYEIFGASSYSGYGYGDGSAKISSSDYIYVVKDSSSAKSYLVVYGKDGVVKRTYQISGKTLFVYGEKDKITGEIESNPFNFYFKKYDSGDFENGYLNAELIYYESGSYKEYPAIVPLDVEDGWYVGIKDADSGVAAYDASGKVRIVWLCNVGKNGLEEFSFYSNDFGDDVCQQYDLTHDVVTFGGLSPDKTNFYLRKAQTSVEKAQDAYRNGVSTVTIDGVGYDVGKPASSSSQVQCESYMSPKDCKLLFNVCDPVVCPSSRCDFGGNYPVSDVVSTGVVGSILLCAPNYKEGIYLPICTTGVQAGLESWVNIEESYRDCLQEYLANGEVTGTCDRIHSIYVCEFFWKEAIPLAKIGISKAVSSISGEGVRGGSEYLGFSSAWQNAKDSVDYFTSYYAAESYKAFKIRSAEEAGSAVCKVSASIVYTSGADLLESLTTPRSPAQYTGSFEETVLTTATNPPQSHYKVYYYIYSGEDIGATYQVYLRRSSGSYYQDFSSTYLVASDYISAGSYVTETPDFTTASGYTELCISVNGAVECGFGKVSTSFAENYLNDLYLEEQATSEVKTEDDCTSGTASLYSLINPNLQDIAEGLTDTDLYSDGITRICATENPGKETDANWNTEDARWRDVGYCGDQSVRCWIDTNTVKDAIRTLNIEESALEDNSDSYLKALTESGNYIDSQGYSEKVSEIKSEGDSEKKIILINEIIDKVFYSNQKAELYLLRGLSYGNLALKNLISERDVISAGEVEEGEEELPETTDEILEETNARQRVLKAAEYLNGKSALKGSVIGDYDKSGSINCFDSTLHVYNTARVTFNCVYSDKVGKEYQVDGETIEIDNKKFFVNENACDLAGLNEESKLNNLKAGDMLSIVYSKEYGHNVIFIEWVDKGEKTAKIFDWINQDSDGNRVFGYRTIDLSDGQYSVYMYWKPVILGDETDEKTEDEGTITDAETSIIKSSNPLFVISFLESSVTQVTQQSFEFVFAESSWYWRISESSSTVSYVSSGSKPVSISAESKWIEADLDKINEDYYKEDIYRNLDLEIRNFIKGLKGKSYSKGLEELTEFVIAQGVKLKTEKIYFPVSSKNPYFFFEDEGRIYFNYSENEGWYFKALDLDRDVDWIKVDNFSIEKETNSRYVIKEEGVTKYRGKIDMENFESFISGLKNKNYGEGLVYLFNQNSDFGNVEVYSSEKFSTKNVPAIIQYLKDKRKEGKDVSISVVVRELKDLGILSSKEFNFISGEDENNLADFSEDLDYLIAFLEFRENLPSLCFDVDSIECYIDYVNRLGSTERYSTYVENRVFTDYLYIHEFITEEQYQEMLPTRVGSALYAFGSLFVDDAEGRLEKGGTMEELREILISNR